MIELNDVVGNLPTSPQQIGIRMYGHVGTLRLHTFENACRTRPRLRVDASRRRLRSWIGLTNDFDRVKTRMFHVQTKCSQRVGEARASCRDETLNGVVGWGGVEWGGTRERMTRASERLPRFSHCHNVSVCT